MLTEFISWTEDHENYSACPTCEGVLAFKHSAFDDDYNNYRKHTRSKEFREESRKILLDLQKRKEWDEFYRIVRKQVRWNNQEILYCLTDGCKYYCCITCGVHERKKHAVLYRLFCFNCPDTPFTGFILLFILFLFVFLISETIVIASSDDDKLPWVA